MYRYLQMIDLHQKKGIGYCSLVHLDSETVLIKSTLQGLVVKLIRGTCNKAFMSHGAKLQFNWAILSNKLTLLYLTSHHITPLQ